MVGRRPSPFMPKKKKATGNKPESQPQKQSVKKPAPIPEPKPVTPETEDELFARGPRQPKKPRVKKPRIKRGVRPSAPQQQLTAEDKRTMRRRRQRRRMAVRIAIAVAVCALFVVVWLNWSVLSPDKVWAWLQDLVSGGTGSFPVDLSGTGARKLEQIDNYTVMLTDSHLTYLNAKGAEVSRYSCTYADALVRSEGKFVLVAEQGGKRLRLTTRNKTVLEKQTSLTIRSVSLNAKGQIAVLTDGPQGFAVQVTVYDKEGKTLYTRRSNRGVVDVALSPDGKTMSLSSVEAADGTLSTHLEVFSLTSADADPQSTYDADGKLLYRLAYLENGTVMAVHEQGVVLVNPDSGKAKSYTQKDKRVLGYAVSGDTVALAMRPYGDTAGGQAVIVSSSGKVKSKLSFKGEFRHLSGHDGKYVLLTDGTAYPFTLSGAKKKISVAADALQAVYADNQIVVMGRNLLKAYSIK